MLGTRLTHQAARRVITGAVALSLAVAPLAFGQETLPPIFSGTQKPEPKPDKSSIEQNLPELGDPSQALLSAVQERKLGEQVMYEVRASGQYLFDPEVNGYLNDLGSRLVAAIPGAPFDFQFFAMSDSSINAFALPGGFVGVNTGLILLTQTESELASVLGHEITHVTQHHIARSMANQKDAVLMSMAAIVAMIIAARVKSESGADLSRAAVATAQGLAIQKQIDFTRENEEEADRLGFARTYAAGFDPNAMATFFERLMHASAWFEGNTPSYFRDHPETYQRIAEAQARAFTKPSRQVPSSLDYFMVRALLKSYEGTPRDAVTFFRESIADKKYNNEIAAHYGLVASYLRAEDLKQAQAELKVLEKMAPPHPMVEGIAGQILMQSGQLKEAVARYEVALVRYPNKMQLIYDYPEALLKDGQAAKAATFLSDQLQRFPGDGQLHQQAAKTYAALGKQLLQHQHQAEYYAWQGNLRAAVNQLELAVKAGDGDFYQVSVAESRLREFRQELAEQEKANGRARPG
jgi:beta-barrel assembly-enhancing protease